MVNPLRRASDELWRAVLEIVVLDLRGLSEIAENLAQTLAKAFLDNRDIRRIRVPLSFILPSKMLSVPALLSCLHSAGRWTRQTDEWEANSMDVTISRNRQ